MTTTDFDRYTHEQLLAMLRGNMPLAVLSGADDLERLTVRLGDAERSLDQRLKALEWHGESADRFRQWADQVLAAARQLTEFTRESGNQLRLAGEQLARTQLPPLSGTDQALASSAVQTERAAAVQRMSDAKEDAVRQMQALASAYQVAAERLERLEEPRFPPAANVLGLDVQTRDQVGLDSGSNPAAGNTPATGLRPMAPPDNSTLKDGTPAPRTLDATAAPGSAHTPSQASHLSSLSPSNPAISNPQLGGVGAPSDTASAWNGAATGPTHAYPHARSGGSSHHFSAPHTVRPRDTAPPVASAHRSQIAAGTNSVPSHSGGQRGPHPMYPPLPVGAGAASQASGSHSADPIDVEADHWTTDHASAIPAVIE